MDRPFLLPKYASYLLTEKLGDFIKLFFERSREINFSFVDINISTFEHEKFDETESKLKELLKAFSDRKNKEFTNELIELWKENKLPNIPASHDGVVVQVTSINIQKYVFIKLLKEYTTDLELREQIILELVEFYSFYFLKLIEAYSEIQQAKILQEKEFSQSIINNSIVGISALDLEHKITEWNPAMENWMNIKRDEVIGKNYYDVFPEYKESEAAQLFKRAYQGEEINLYGKAYVGREGWYDAHFTPLYNDKKEVIGALSISHDITDRKKGELKIKEDQHFIQTLADSSPDVITVYDLEKNMNIYSSKEIYQILGYNPEELKALIEKGVQGLVETIHPDDLATVIGFLESYRTYTGSESRELEYRIKDNKGKYRHILDRYNVFKKSPEGFPTQIIGIARDNTARKETEEKLIEYSKEIHDKNQELMQALEELKSAEENLIYLNNRLEDGISSRTQELLDSNNELRRINSDLDNFIYTASHDLKAPISNIEGLMATLKKNLPKETIENKMVDKVLNLVEASIDRFKRTILELTEISKVQKDSGKDVALINLPELASEVEKDLEYLMLGQSVKIEHNFSSDEEIMFSKKNMRSVFYNLISNAVKYRSPERPLEITLFSKTENGYKMIAVQDNGLGIDMSQKDKIFSMFKRLHTHVEGSGVGLYILKKIIDNAGGRIEVESEVGKGSTFKIFLKDNY